MRKTALQRLMTCIYSLIFRGHVESLCPFWSLIWDLIHIKSRFLSILVLILPPRVGTGDSSAQCSFLLFTMTKKDPISVTNGGENKKKSSSGPRLLLTCWFLLQKLSLDEPTASDPTAQETNDQPAESEAPPPAGTNRPTDAHDEQVVLLHVMYGMFSVPGSHRADENHTLSWRSCSEACCLLTADEPDEQRPQESLWSFTATSGQFQMSRFISNRFCGVNKLKSGPRSLKSLSKVN